MHPSIKYPPQGYSFNEIRYKGLSHPLNPEYSDFGESIRSLYPELSSWSNWACFDAWTDYGEKTQYLADTNLPTERDEGFLAFLYAEQELGANGYFVRPDGTRFTHYDLDRLGEIWRKYEVDHQSK